MSEIEAAVKAYGDEVQNSDLGLSSQAVYLDHVKRFVRWLRFDFEPGSRNAPKPCQSCGETMYAEPRNLHVFWKKKKCCYHCELTGGKEHSHYCSTADGLRHRGEQQVYMPGGGFIPLEVGCAGGKRPVQKTQP